MPPALKLLQHLLSKGVKATATLWPPLQSAYEQVHQAAHILANPQQHTGTQVRERYLAHVCQMQEQKASMEPLREAIEHFCHITENFAAGLFHCYDVEGLPRTNNDLELSAGATCGRTCSGVRKPVGSSSASAKIPLPIWRLWKLNYSREVCHSAKN